MNANADRSRALVAQILLSTVLGYALLAAMLFLIAGTYMWPAAALTMGAQTLYCCIGVLWLAIRDPTLLARRVRGGPQAEKSRAQQIIVIFVWISMFAELIIVGLDRRFGWSQLPKLLLLNGQALTLLGFLCLGLTFKTNSFAAATVEIFENQVVCDRGVYGVVRHPMYLSIILIFAGTALSLGSVWGLLAVPTLVGGLALRALDEERMLRRQLSGYADYMTRVRWRFAPIIW